ncbi:XTP/dITP diphosphatase [Brevibacillus sp. SYSU BS000544]|uniref:XTP/dITP diphosphatase n=1 Tax=Brevibacillus sp. SYSU BS000544 TaxID=3416443 RepID=UPI003CE50814
MFNEEKRIKIVVATRNQGKVREFNEMFQQFGWEAVSLAEYPDVPEVVEDGETFEANARKKAETIAAFLNIPAIGDDSGLEVDAIGGKPGVYSARFAGENATDEDNWRKLLQLMQDVPNEKRTARFRCVLAFARPNEETITANGHCEGAILREPAGTNGFGYDPVFFLPDRLCTMAQLSAEQKNKISHRAMALHNLVEKIRGIHV